MNYQLNDGVSSVFKVVEALLLKLSLTFGKSLFLPWGRKIVINSLCVGQFNELQGGNVSLVFPHLCNNMKMFNIKIMQRGNYQLSLTLSQFRHTGKFSCLESARCRAKSFKASVEEILMEMEKAKWNKTCLKLSASVNNPTDIVYSNSEWPGDVLSVILKHFRLIPNPSTRCSCTRTGFLILKTALFYSITLCSFE